MITDKDVYSGVTDLTMILIASGGAKKAREIRERRFHLATANTRHG